MRKLLFPLLLLGVICVMVSCKKEKESEVIFVDEPDEVVDTTTIDIGVREVPTKTVEWSGAPCNITVNRVINKERPLVVDEDGRKYYDTEIIVRVTDKEGKTFFERTFTKDDFYGCVNSRWKKEGVLLGLPFTEVENGQLTFRGSVGSPASTSDEYDPVVMRLNLSGGFSVAYDNKPDMEMGAATDEDGV